MKKIFLFLILVIAMPLFASTMSEVNVFSFVKETYIEPSFSLMDMEDLSTKSNLSRSRMVRNEIEMDFLLVQKNMSKFSGIIFLDISASGLNGSTPEIIDVNVNSSEISTSYANKRFMLTYYKNKNIDAFSIGSFKIKWQPGDNFEQDSAQISFTCTVL